MRARPGPDARATITSVLLPYPRTTLPEVVLAGISCVSASIAQDRPKWPTGVALNTSRPAPKRNHRTRAAERAPNVYEK
eukprot:190152-Prymnesium_polylepis.1